MNADTFDPMTFVFEQVERILLGNHTDLELLNALEDWANATEDPATNMAVVAAASVKLYAELLRKAAGLEAAIEYAREGLLIADVEASFPDVDTGAEP
jgi:hypothetical protein